MTPFDLVLLVTEPLAQQTVATGGHVSLRQTLSAVVAGAFTLNAAWLAGQISWAIRITTNKDAL